MPNRQCPALALSLLILAGCAVPATPPVPLTTEGDSVPAAVTPLGDSPAPVAPAPAPAAISVFEGIATFRGEPLAGYSVEVIDARTGEPVPQAASLAGATGLAVLQKERLTDAAGRFRFQATGLGPGQALRVTVSKGSAQLEAIATSAVPAAGMRVLQAGSPLTVSELTTAIAQITRGVFLTSSTLTPPAAAPVINQLLTNLSGLSPRLEQAMQQQPALANGVVNGQNGTGVTALVSSINALQTLSQNVAQMVAAIAQAAQQMNNQASAANAAAQARLAEIQYLGTVLSGSVNGGTFTLTNRITGQTFTAGSGDLSQLTARVSTRHRSPDAPTGPRTLRNNPRITTFVSDIDSPSGLATDADGNLYVADAGAGLLRKFTPSGEETVYGSNANLLLPSQVALKPDGTLYVADRNRRVVLTLGPTPLEVPTTVLGVTNAPVSFPAANTVLAVNTYVDDSRAMAVSPDGALYVALKVPYSENATLWRLENNGDLTRVAGTNGTLVPYGYGNYYSLPVTADEGAALTKALGYITDLAFDGQGNLYIACPKEHVVFKLDAAGQISLAAGTLNTRGHGGDGGPATAATLNRPYGLDVDWAGNLYIADRDNCAVRKVDPQGNISTVAILPGAPSSTSDYQSLYQDALLNLIDVAADRNGNLYVSDATGHAVHKLF